MISILRPSTSPPKSSAAIFAAVSLPAPGVAAESPAMARAPDFFASNQQSLARNVIELEPHSIRVFEQQRIISRRPLIFARRADDRHVERTQKAVQLIDVGALAGTKTEMVQADAALLEYCPATFGRRLAYPERRASAHAVLEFV